MDSIMLTCLVSSVVGSRKRISGGFVGDDHDVEVGQIDNTVYIVD